MATTEKRKSTPNQRQVIKIWQKQSGIDDDIYRDRLEADYGVRSCTELTHSQAGHLISTIVREGHYIPGQKTWKRPARKRTAAVPRAGKNVVRMASRAELEKIDAVAGLIQWRVDNGLARWMKKRFGFERVKTAYESWKVIEGLKKMFENRMKKDFGERWWVMRFDDERIRTYIFEHCPKRYRAQAEYNNRAMEDTP
ncbi:hypothetical protein DSCO28_50600 [Desulfosarcina ovata subsp. sediminis]|uniref:GemA protein n=1 Tax=Desulfosarcina ovata subsp. sediminis TaxID=885957 RepID=A0A5K7ZWD7_9BACT|nr:regulatory protein GemA [Desulfosarcina ovata]BBO80188.1 hypothetical protein DSCO28_07540 [Desulfosarcina ovata subsp. sediminis]BBO84494.1 hypothetical protein DSCO28_50600 [Desulfosarcina ovata subsp. sediminis]